MASYSALTEEGRTRIRNFQGRFNSYLLLWLVIGVLAVFGAIWVRTRYGYLPLQRLYLAQYIKASVKSLVPRNQPSRYMLLVRVIEDRAHGGERIIPCTDNEVSPIRDETGRVRFDPKLGPFFRLHEGIPYDYFYWRGVRENDSAMYRFFHDHIYEGRSLIRLYWICFLPLPLLVSAGMILSVQLDLRTNREYEEGTLVRGVRLLRPFEYSRETRQVRGIGLPVFRPERSRR